MLERVLTGLVVVPFLLGAAAAPVDHEQVVQHFTDPDIVEASGLVVDRGLYVTTNDSGDTGRIFAADATGRTVGVTHWSADPVDTEAIAPDGPGRVWVGDIGDNDSVRTSVDVTEVPVGRGERTVSPTIYRLRYPDGAHNAETLMHDPVTGRLYIATKGLLGGTVYAVPEHLSAISANVLDPVGDVLPIATDGAFFPDGRHIIVRNYTVATVYAWPSLQRVSTFALPAQPQGEGIAVHDGQLYLSSEGRDSEVLRTDLPAGVRRVVEPSAPSTAAPSASPVPSSAPGSAAGSAAGSGEEPPTVTQSDSSPWPWLLSGALGLAVVAVLIRSMRPR